MEDKIFDSEFLKKLDNIALNAKITMNEGAAGGRKSKAKGSSVEFSDFREYSIGDDFRRIDWNAYGRFERLFVKLFMEEREAIVNIFIDCSKSMDFGSPKKCLTALKLSGVLSFLALNNLDRVCINQIKGTVLNQSNSVTGKNMFYRCLDFLQKTEFSGETNINGCLKRKDIKARGISIIISDFFSKDGMEEGIKYLLYKNQQVILIHVLSPEELKPEIYGQVRLVDSESGEGRNLTITPTILKHYEKNLNLFINNIKSFSNKLGVTYIQVSSEDKIEKIIFDYLAQAGVINY
ncbi:DUF58 domain-containing protein [Clostridium sp. SYSU_GA19001]|uniref:DUF58 domain-containing protein n=1 Tax=Clostridium caldaquaticum TaxID=2940653 RepID=UPI002076EE71|nr:DUF58 domain-containing protein [Clostridium caldaquaticum]MCM8711784.1 DUF58 domain-containing protein [Clostridium caldaquaticum]